MSPHDVCKKCDGVMKLVNKQTGQHIDCTCKASFGWDPAAWRMEQTRLGVSFDQDGRTSK